MKRWILAGALALAMVGPAYFDHDRASAGAFEGRKITDVNLAAIKAELKLSAAQLPLWQHVEEALRAIAREQAQEESAGLLRRVGRRVVAVVFDDSAMLRLREAAMPLLASLSEEQKVVARRVAHKLGMADMMALAH